MESIIWLIIMLPCSALFTRIGIFAWKRKKPMWFWSGSEVSEYEISDIPAYNRANGIMWIAYSSVFWLISFIGLLHPDVAGIILAVGCIIGIPVLMFVYNRIYSKYKN